MTHDLHHLAAAYSLDALDDDERRAFEAHYPTCEICDPEIRELRETAARLGEAESTQPRPEVKERLMAEVRVTRQLSPRLPDAVVDLAERRRGRLGRSVMMAAAAAVVIALATIGVLRGGDGPDDLGRLVAAPDTVLTDLDGEGGLVRVLWSAERDQLAVVGDELPDPGPGQDYVLWFVSDGELSRAGAFDADAGTPEILDVDDIDAQGWGVTIESDPETDEPTGDVIFAGTI